MGTAKQITPTQTPDYVDYGDAGTIYYDGVARAEAQGGMVFFALWRWVTTVIDGRVDRKKVVVNYLVTTQESVQDAMAQCAELLGASDRPETEAFEKLLMN